MYSMCKCTILTDLNWFWKWGWLIHQCALVPGVRTYEFQPWLGLLDHWFDGPRREDKKFMVVTNISTSTENRKSKWVYWRHEWITDSGIWRSNWNLVLYFCVQVFCWWQSPLHISNLTFDIFSLIPWFMWIRLQKIGLPKMLTKVNHGVSRQVLFSRAFFDK